MEIKKKTCLRPENIYEIIVTLVVKTGVSWTKPDVRTAYTKAT
jgi:hypothetical protein